MIDREKVKTGIFEMLQRNTWKDIDKERHRFQPVLNDVLILLKEQEEQKRKWLQTIADTQLAISPTGYESEDELAKRGWEWNGLQMAWEIIAGEERSEHPRIVRCKDCDNAVVYDDNEVICTHIDSNGNDKHSIDWFCADGERREENG